MFPRSKCVFSVGRRATVVGAGEGRNRSLVDSSSSSSSLFSPLLSLSFAAATASVRIAKARLRRASPPTFFRSEINPFKGHHSGDTCNIPRCDTIRYDTINKYPNYHILMVSIKARPVSLDGTTNGRSLTTATDSTNAC